MRHTGDPAIFMVFSKRCKPLIYTFLQRGDEGRPTQWHSRTHLAMKSATINKLIASSASHPIWYLKIYILNLQSRYHHHRTVLDFPTPDEMTPAIGWENRASPQLSTDELGGGKRAKQWSYPQERREKIIRENYKIGRTNMSDVVSSRWMSARSW